MKEKTVLELENIYFSNENYLVLDNISLDIKLNTFNCIVGRSGAGKSTLLKIMAGLLTPNMGRVIINNNDITKLFEKDYLRLRRRIGFAFQDAALISNLSIKENLILPLKYRFKNITEKQIEKRVGEIIEKISLEDSLYLRPAQLSHGEQKLVSIMRAIITEPELLFLDEPLTSIDATLGKRIIQIINEYSIKEWTTVIIVTHSKNLIADNATNLFLIEDKKISYHLDKDEIQNIKIDNLPQLLKDIFS